MGLAGQGAVPYGPKVLERYQLVHQSVGANLIKQKWHLNREASMHFAWRAIGHPLGASRARLTTALLNELERTVGRFGLQTAVRAAG